MTKSDFFIGLIICLAAAAIPFGIFMGFYTDQSGWFWLSVGAVIFFMAG